MELTVKTFFEFLSFFFRDLTRWLGSSERAKGVESMDQEIDYGQFKFLGHVDRKTWELLALGLVGLPLIGYLFSVFVPKIWSFWFGRYGA